MLNQTVRRPAAIVAVVATASRTWSALTEEEVSQAAMQARRGPDGNLVRGPNAQEDGAGRSSDGAAWSDPEFLRAALRAALANQASTATEGCAQ